MPQNFLMTKLQRKHLLFKIIRGMNKNPTIRKINLFQKEYKKKFK